MVAGGVGVVAHGGAHGASRFARPQSTGRRPQRPAAAPVRSMLRTGPPRTTAAGGERATQQGAAPCRTVLAHDYAGTQAITPSAPVPSEIHPCASMSARVAAFVVYRWLGAPPCPSLYSR